MKKCSIKKIYDGNLVQQIEVCKRFEENLEVRERIKNQFENSKLKERKVTIKRNRQKIDSLCDPSVDIIVCNQPSFG